MKFVTPSATPTANTLIYGESKTGKTIGACTAPKPLLLLNFDLPTASRQAHLRNPGGIFEPEMPSFEEGKTTSVYNLMTEVYGEVLDPGTRFKTVVVDTVGEMHRRLLEDSAQRAIRPKRDFYGDVGVHVERFCRSLCMLSHINVVLICHELSQKDGEEGEFRRIAFTGTKGGSETLSGKLMSMVDIIAYAAMVETEENGKQWLAQLIQGKGRNGGDRFDCLGDYRTVNISEWLQIIEEHEAKITGSNGSTPIVSTSIPKPAAKAAKA